MRLLPFSRFVVFGNSMHPTLKVGQNVVTFNWIRKINAQDIVVVRIDDRLVIKRVKRVYEKKLFIVGDNDQESTDSRKYGAVDRSNLIGKVVITF